MIILKLGGSLITDKTKKFSVRHEVLKKLAEEIKSGTKDELLIVHGGGSFGHPIADEYGLNRGFKDKDQIKGVALTRKAMDELNLYVVKALVDADIPAVAVQPSSNIICKNGRIEEINISTIKRFIKMGMVPVLYGDVVLDTKLGFCILSGDQIISYLARYLKPKRGILCVDVDGIHDKDPKGFKDAVLIKEINKTNRDKALSKLEETPGDVTGGIKGKVLELINLADSGVESIVINGLVAGRLEDALMGREVTGTLIKGG
ncbi:MAG: isopentenyl phosphate kinase [Candidatus Hydrothermarchaeales archaeon]